MGAEWNVHPNDERVKILCSIDVDLKKLIDQVGPIKIPFDLNPYQSLVSSIIGQQLSVKAAGTIRGRVVELVGELTPEAILSKTDEELRSTGLSSSKIKYIKDLSEKVLTKELHFEGMDALHNDEVIARLTSVKGIGKWTAEMFLIFTFGKADVLSLGDAGLQRAAKWLYQTENALELKGEQWNPYQSIASLYLWEAVDRGYVNQYASIDHLRSDKS